jgi:hypothetical protein
MKMNGGKSLQVFFIVVFFFIYIVAGDPIIRGGNWDPINQFNPSHIYVPVSNQDLDLQQQMSLSLLCSMMM